MKNQTRKNIPAQLRSLLAVCFMLGAAHCATAQSVWNAVAGTSADTNWSSAVNWTPNTVPSGAVVFNNTATAPNATTINNVVDSSFGGTITSLAYTNSTTGTFENTVIAAGVTLNVNGALSVGSATLDPGAGVTTTATISGTGKLNVNSSGSSIFVAWGDTTGATGPATLNMTNLDTFAANVSRLQIGEAGVNRSAGAVYLAKTNTITAGSTGTGTGSAIVIGDNGSNNGNGSTLNLGLTNAIYADNIGAGLRKQNGSSGIRFNPSFTNNSPVAYFRGKDGVSPVANWNLGDGTSASATVTTTGYSDFSGGTVNAVVNAMVLARCAVAATGGRTANGTLTLTAGIFSVNTLTSAVLATSNGETATGTVNVRGTGTLAVNSSLILGSLNGFTGNALGTLNITGGTVQANTVVGGGGTSTITINGGTLIVTNTAGTSLAPVTAFNATSATLSLPVVSGADGAVNATTLTLAGAGTTINVVSNGTLASVLSGGYPQTVHLIKFTSLNGDTNATPFVLGPMPIFNGSLLLANIVTNTGYIDLMITGGGTPPPPPKVAIWTGINNNGSVGDWDLATGANTLNWKTNNGPATGYADSDNVLFDDTAPGQTNVNITTTVSPGSVVMTNNLLAYAFSGSGGIHGSAAFNKQGTNLLVIDNSGANDFSGGLTIGAGTVQVGRLDSLGGVTSLGTGAIIDNGALVLARNDDLTLTSPISGTGTLSKQGNNTVILKGAGSYTGATTISSGTVRVSNSGSLGATNGTVTVASGAVLDLGANGTAQGLSFGIKPFVVAGTGSGDGVIINSVNTNQQFAFMAITLADDATFGGVGRWDMRSNTVAVSSPPALDLSGHKLTKVGANQISLVGATVTSGDIEVDQGSLSFESGSAVNGTGTITINSSGTLNHFRTWGGAVTRPITLNGGTIGNLSTGGGNSTNDAPITLTADSTVNVLAGSDLLLRGVISNADGSFGLTKVGPGRLVLAGPGNNYGGATTVSVGQLVLNTINSNAGDLTVNFVGAGQSIAGGNGTNTGSVNIQDTLWPGVGGSPGTFGSGSLTFSGDTSSALMMSLGSATTPGGGVNDLVNVNGNLVSPIANLTIVATSGTLAAGSYRLINFTGSSDDTFGGQAQFSLHPATLGRQGLAMDYSVAHQINLTVTAGSPGPLIWNNASGDGQWNVQSSFNWANVAGGTNDMFFAGDTVVLDDSITTAASPNTTLNLAAGVVVSPLMVTNNSSATNYTIVGAGKISGVASLVKQGNSTLAINTTNDFTGNVTIAGGAVRFNNTNALGSWTSGTVTVTNGGTLDLGGLGAAVPAAVFGGKQFYLAGAGVGGNGAIYNSGAFAQQNAFQKITLTADATFGGATRWDMRGGAPGPLLDLGGFTLMKEGTNQISLVGVIVTNNGNVVINNGILSFETLSTFTNGTGSITVNPSGTLAHFRQVAGLFTRPVILNGGTITNLSGGGATNDSPISLTADSFVGAPSGNDLYLDGVISSAGTFGLTKVAPGNVLLTNVNTYGGDTVVSLGTLSLTNTGSINASRTISITAGAALNVMGRTDGKLTLTAGQTLKGGGTVTGGLAVNSGATVAPGTAAPGTLTVSGVVTMSGGSTNAIRIDKTTLPAANDVLRASVVAYNGVLQVVPLNGTTFAADDSFKIFDSTLVFYSGAFSAINPATPGAGLAWDTSSLITSGTLKVVAAGGAPVPRITEISVSGNTLTLSGTNGAAGQPYVLLSSTNVAQPLGLWVPIATNVFDGSGNFSFSTNIDGSLPQQFYLISQ